MRLRQTIARKLILQADPHAFDEDSLLAEIEKNEHRIANDPEIQERRRIVQEESERAYDPLFLAALITFGCVWGALAYFCPGIVKVPAAVLGMAFSNAIWCVVSKDMASPTLISWASSASVAAVLLVLFYILSLL